MRHARPDDLTHIAPLLAKLRAFAALKEKTPGTFYRKSRGFLHFHEHKGALFADIRDGEDWRRCTLTGERDESALLAAVTRACAPDSAPKSRPPERSARRRR